MNREQSNLALLAQELAESQWYDSVEKVGLEMILLDKTHVLVPREVLKKKGSIISLAIREAELERSLAASQASVENVLRINQTREKQKDDEIKRLDKELAASQAENEPNGWMIIPSQGGYQIYPTKEEAEKELARVPKMYKYAKLFSIKKIRTVEG